MDEQLLTVVEAAQRRGVTRDTVYRAIRGGRLPYVQVLGKIGLRPAEVDACEFGSYGGIERARIARGRGPKKGAKAGT